MTGALARYRNMDRDWEDLADFDGAPITQPSLFIGGGLDASTTWLADAIKAYPVTLPGLVDSHLLDDCGHWIQQERAAEVNPAPDRLARRTARLTHTGVPLGQERLRPVGEPVRHRSPTHRSLDPHAPGPAGRSSGSDTRSGRRPDRSGGGP